MKEIQASKFEDSPFGFADFDRNDALQKHENFVRTLRNNNFATAVGLLEEHFRGIVNSSPKQPNISLSTDELNGENLRKPFTYLTKILGYDLTSMELDLKELMTYYYEYRNRVVHNLGHIKIEKGKGEAEQGKLFNFLVKFPSIDVNKEFGRVTIKGKSFTIDFCDKAESFLLKIVKGFKK